MGALGVEGIAAAMSVEAATDEAVFHAFLDEMLLPKLQMARPDAVLLGASGFGYHDLSSYSLDLNSIEPGWANIKGKLRQAAARTADALHKALGPMLEAITAKGTRRCFRNSGYSVVGPKRKPL